MFNLNCIHTSTGFACIINVETPIHFEKVFFSPLVSSHLFYPPEQTDHRRTNFRSHHPKFCWIRFDLTLDELTRSKSDVISAWQLMLWCTSAYAQANYWARAPPLHPPPPPPTPPHTTSTKENNAMQICAISRSLCLATLNIDPFVLFSTRVKKKKEEKVKKTTKTCVLMNSS